MKRHNATRKQRQATPQGSNSKQRGMPRGSNAKKECHEEGTPWGRKECHGEVTPRGSNAKRRQCHEMGKRHMKESVRKRGNCSGKVWCFVVHVTVIMPFVSVVVVSVRECLACCVDLEEMEDV